jgi:hypothetical protein
MKILHTLVGYLAITALSFHPFAFASPLAATSNNSDGYVDTSQNHIDSALMTSSALMKRVPGDTIIEARQVEVVLPAVVIIYAIITEVFLIILWISGDDPVRGNDRGFLVSTLI